MQGAHDWAENLNKTFEGHGYYRSKADPQIRLRVLGDEFILTSTQTDDVLGALSTIKREHQAKGELQLSYEIKDLEEAKLILGIRVDRDQETDDITLSQQAYCQRVLVHFNMNGCAPSSILLPVGLSLSIEDYPSTPEEVEKMAKVPYQEALDAIMWLQVVTRPDLSYAINVLSRFAHNPGKQHQNALKHVLSYIKGTSHYGITYKGGGNLTPVGYVDSNYAGCKDTHRSMEGSVFIVARGPVSWEYKCQATVALSTVEAEYMEFSRATTQAIWLAKFFDKIELPTTALIHIYADNMGSIANTVHGKNHRRMKHIDVKHHFIKEHVELDMVAFEYTPSNENLADLFIKPLSQDALQNIITNLGLIPRKMNTLVQREYCNELTQQTCLISSTFC